MPKRIEISHRTIIFIAFFLGILWFASQIWDIILMFFVSLILTTALKPAVDNLEKLKIPRALAIIFIYVVLWIIVGTVIASIVPPLVVQTRKLIELLPQAISNFDYFNNNQQEITNQVLSLFGAIPENVLKVAINVFGNIINLFTTVILSFYLLLERKNLDQHLSMAISPKVLPDVKKVIIQIENKIGNWVRGELLLMTIIGIMTYLGLLLLGLDTALPLAILAGFLEIVPTIGPIISAIPAVIIATVIHPFLGLSTIALYFLIQFLENNFFVPQIMQKTTGVSPLASILGLLIGFRFGGVVGAILAIPTILIIQSIGLRFFSVSHLEDISELDEKGKI